MHVRPRKTRILYGGKFFSYPVELSLDTVRKLGVVKMFKIGITYLYAVFFPIRPEKTLEDFFVNRFGKELYNTFFRSYTEKVWGVPCKELSAAWGAQRVKGLSIGKAVHHAVSKLFRAPLSGKKVETSLIEQFLYPAYGPGHMWETVARHVRERGGEIRMGAEVKDLTVSNKRATAVRIREGDKESNIAADYVFSTTDVRALVRMLSAKEEVLRIAEGLQYRDFLTVGLLLDHPPKEPDGTPICDTWMYIHEPDVSVGRVQFFHNWDPLLVADQKRGWTGLEFFCNETDALWNMRDSDLISLGERELRRVGLCEGNTVLDGTVIRQPKAYPGYFGSYDKFDVVRRFLDGFDNLFPIGRNGMHRYNNQDHSMLAAMTAVDSILGKCPKENMWDVNTEEVYHEQK
jgi:protoporphyrinogen oxidase